MTRGHGGSARDARPRFRLFFAVATVCVLATALAALEIGRDEQAHARIGLLALVAAASGGAACALQSRNRRAVERASLEAGDSADSADSAATAADPDHENAALRVQNNG